MNSELLDKKYCVYKHTSPSNKVYIGITCKSPTDRWASGFGYSHQIYFFRAIVKYGWINFKHEILFDGLTKEEAENKEVELIAHYKSTDLNFGYNIDLGGNLHKLSEITRKKISEAKKGKKWTEKQRLASIEYFKKHPKRKVYKYTQKGELVAEFSSCQEAAIDAGVHKNTMYQKLYERKFPSNWKYIYSYDSFDKAFIQNPKATYNAKPIDMFDLSLNYLRTFNSIEDAKRFLGNGKGGHIWDVCNGKRLKCNNYIWRYHNENTDNKIA